MKKIFFRQFLMISSLIACFSCSSYLDTEYIGDIKTIKYGTSFGMCIGYCKNEVIINSKNIVFNSSGWQENVKPINITESFTESDWEELCTTINIDAFYELPETIGCPDCADGGAEWIEIELANGKIHKVVFEYYKEPEMFKKNIVKFRELLEKNKKYK